MFALKNTKNSDQQRPIVARFFTKLDDSNALQYEQMVNFSARF